MSSKSKNIDSQIVSYIFKLFMRNTLEKINKYIYKYFIHGLHF